MLEAERLRVEDLRFGKPGGRREGGERSGEEALAERQRSVEGRIEELEAKAALLRAQLARLSQPAAL